MASWRDVLPIHPAANLFPLMSPDELRALGEDIRKHGLASPVVLWRADDKAPLSLLDGRNHLDAIGSTAGDWKPGTGKWEGSGKVIVLDHSVDPFAYVISANIHRRHLTAEQKREIVAALLKANPERSNNATAKIAKVDDKTVGAVRAELERRSEIPNVSTRTDSKGRKQPARKSKPTAEQAKEAGRILGRLERADEAVQRDFIRHLPAEMLADRDDISPVSSGEIARIRARNEELETENARLRRENMALRSEIEELKARLSTAPPPADDGLDIPDYLRRTAP